MKLKHLFLTFSFVVGIFSVAFAQQQQTALNVATTNPSESMNFAGNEQACFVSNITNSATDGSGMFIDDLQLQIPDGFDLVSLSLVKNETTLVSNSLSMQLNDTLRPSEYYTLNYCIRVNCDAVPTNISNQFSVFFSNNLQVHYTEHDTIKTFEKRTNDFKLEVPSLSLTVGVGNANTHNNVKNIVWQTPVTDTFTIRNTAGAGSISNLRVSMLLMQNVDAFSDVKFSIVGGQFRNAEVASGQYYIDLSSSDFQQAGLGDTFDSNEQLRVAVSFIPTKFYLQTQAKYLAQVKNGSDECNEQINASAICDYHCSEPNVALSAIMAVTQRANYCEQDFQCNVTVANESFGGLTNTLRNARLFIPTTRCRIKSVQYNGEILSIDTNGEFYYLPVNDVDGDGKGDLRPQESCTIQIQAEPTTVTDNVNLYVYLYGETIDGIPVNARCNAGTSLPVNRFSLISPSDSKSGEPAKYPVDVDLNGYYCFYDNSFLDVDYIGIMYDGNIEQQYERISNIRRVDTIEITASCEKPQLFNLVVKTIGCDAFYTSQSKEGNSIVECPDSLGNSCISVHTINVEQITPQEINTCETFTVNATGEFAYLSNDTCSRPQRIIARVYDLDGNLQFESTSCSILVNGSSYAIQQSNEKEVNNGIAWASDVMSFPNSGTLNIIPLQLTAELFIKGNHALPDMSNCNIRVEFAVEDEENIIHDANSKGSSLVVYDPQPFVSGSQFGAFPTDVCSGRIGYALRTTLAAPTVINHPIRITHVELPAVAGYYYTTISEVGLPFSADINNGTEGFYSNNGISWANFAQDVHCICATDGTVIDRVNGTLTYTDFYQTCSDTTRITKTIAQFSNYRAPIIEMNSSVEQALTTLTTWNVFVKNTGGANAPNVTLRIKPNENNITDLHIARITVNGKNASRTEYPLNSGIFYVNIGDILVNANTPVKVSVTMSGCTGEGTSYLDVTAIWSCEDIMTMTNLPEEFELRNCNNFFTQLELENMEAVLVAEASYPTEGTKFKLCQEIPIHLDIYNSGRANLSNVGFAIKESSLPIESLLDKSVYVTYAGDGLKIQQDIDDFYLSDLSYKIPDSANSVISDVVLMETDLSTRTSNNDIVELDFKIKVECKDQTIIPPIEFKTSALGNCGEYQEKRFLYYLPIDGLDQIQMVGVTASSSPFTAMQPEGIAEGQIIVTITNNSLEPMDNPIVGIDLPDGISVTTTSGSSSILGFSLQTIEGSNDALNVRLLSPSNYSIPAGGSRTFTISLQENKNCPQLLSEASIYAEIPVDVASECGTNTCRVRARTERVAVELNRLLQPVIVTITGADTVCVGNEVTLTASGADSYQWSTGSTNATTEVTYPTSTYHVTGTTSDGCSGEAEHTITFVERLTQPQLVLVVGSDTVTNGKIQYSDWNTMGEQIIHPISDVEGSLTKISEPNDGKCGIYEYQYTITNQCDSLATSITFEVENCDTTVCEDGDLVVIEGKPGYTLEDLDALRGYVQEGATLQPSSDGGFTMTIHNNCGETIYMLNSCFLNNADMNGDGVINNDDVELLAHIILEHYKYK